jgi:hypothetical protein
MIASDKIAVFTIAFGAVYAVMYTICTEANLPLLTYHPVIGELDPLWTPEKRGPAMYWYGWMLSALIGASAVALVATAVPERWLQLAMLLGSVAAVTYLIFFSIALFIYDQASTELPWLQSRWLAAATAAVVAASFVWLLPAGWRERLWPGWVWVIPLGTLTVLGYYLSPYFTH